MAFTTIEEAEIKRLREDADIKTFLGTKADRKVYIASLRPQLVKTGALLFPNLSVTIDYGAQEPAIHAMNGICTIMMEFQELKRGGGTPIKYKDMSQLKERVMDAVHKVDFSTGDLVINHFNLLSGSQPIFILEDKLWSWPLLFEFVHEDLITKDRIGV